MRGNLVTRALGANTYYLGYDAEKRMTGAARATSVYDGNRVQSTTGGVTTAYVGNYYEWNGTAGIKYYYAGGQRVAMRQQWGSYDVLSYLVADHLVSTSLVLDSQGTVVAESRYFPYGEAAPVSGALPTDHQFTGQLRDSGIGLYSYGARWYDPYIKQAIDNGARTQLNVTPQGDAVVQFVDTISGQQVVVRAVQLANGIIKVTDAWVQTK